MRILFDARVLNGNGEHWGVGVFTKEVISRLRHKYEFIGLAHSSLKTSITDLHYALYPSLPKLKWFMFEIYPLIYRDYDIFWGTNHFIPAYTNFKPNIVTVHDLLLIKYPNDQKLTRLLKNRFISSLNRANIVVCVSETTANDLIDLFKHLKSKIRVIKQGVSVPNMDVKQDIEQDDGFLSELHKFDYFFLVPGAHRPRKNLGLVVNALNLLQEKTKLKIGIVVTGDIHNEFSKLIDNQRIISTGMLIRDDYFKVLRRATALLYPSLYEGFGLPVLEAMALGVPVVLLDTAISHEVGGKAAILLPNDPFVWSKVMYELIHNYEFRDEYSKAGIERSKLFSWDKCAEEYEKLFSEFK